MRRQIWLPRPWPMTVTQPRWLGISLGRLMQTVEIGKTASSADKKLYFPSILKNISTVFFSSTSESCSTQKTAAQPATPSSFSHQARLLVESVLDLEFSGVLSLGWFFWTPTISGLKLPFKVHSFTIISFTSSLYYIINSASHRLLPSTSCCLKAYSQTHLHNRTTVTMPPTHLCLKMK